MTNPPDPPADEGAISDNLAAHLDLPRPTSPSHSEPTSSSATEIPPPRPMTEIFVSIPEIADLAGVKVATIELWRHRRSERKLPWPEEDDAIGPHPIWRLERIRAWLEATGRDYFEDRWREKRAAGGYRRPAARDSAKAAYRRRTQQ